MSRVKRLLLFSLLMLLLLGFGIFLLVFTRKPQHPEAKSVDLTSVKQEAEKGECSDPTIQKLSTTEAQNDAESQEYLALCYVYANDYANAAVYYDKASIKYQEVGNREKAERMTAAATINKVQAEVEKIQAEINGYSIQENNEAIGGQ